MAENREAAEWYKTERIEPRRGGHYAFIDYLRVLGMFLVMWPHLTANMNPEWKPLLLVRWLVNRPLAIGQNFGALGVSLFFIISGFLMCEPSRRAPEKPAAYFLYKAAGILLPLWSAMLGFYLFIKALGLIPGFSCYWSQFSAQDWIRSAALYNFAVLQPERVNAVLWFLVPFLMSVLLMTAYRVCSRKPPIRFVLFSLAFIAAVFAGAEYLPPAIAANAVYIPILLLGYLTNLWVRCKEKRRMTAACGGACYLLLVWGFYRFMPNDYENERYILSAVLALLIFAGCLGRSLERERERERERDAEGGPISGADILFVLYFALPIRGPRHFGVAPLPALHGVLSAGDRRVGDGGMDQLQNR